MNRTTLILCLLASSLILAFCPVSWGAPPPHPVMENTPPTWFTNASATAYELVTILKGLPVAPASGAVFQMQVGNPGSFPTTVTVDNPGSFPTEVTILNPASFPLPTQIEVTNPGSFPSNPDVGISNPASFPGTPPAGASYQTVNALTPGFVTTPANCVKVFLQVTTLGKQVWYSIGSTTAGINGSDSELLTWAAEIDCGPGQNIGYSGSESARLVFRMQTK